MARKIEWAKLLSTIDSTSINFCIEKNNSDSYSKKLEELFNDAAKLISEFPQIGTETDFPGLRVKIVKNYKLFYSDQADTIRIIRIWDTRQDPQRLKLP